MELNDTYDQPSPTKLGDNSAFNISYWFWECIAWRAHFAMIRVTNCLYIPESFLSFGHYLFALSIFLMPTDNGFEQIFISYVEGN